MEEKESGRKRKRVEEKEEERKKAEETATVMKLIQRVRSSFEMMPQVTKWIFYFPSFLEKQVPTNEPSSLIIN